MRIHSGNPISFTPDNSGWVATFETAKSKERWTLPVIGWAVVTTWTGWEGEDRESASDHCETSIEAVVLTEDAYPEPVGAYTKSTVGDAKDPTTLVLLERPDTK